MISGFQDVALPDQCVNLMRESSSHFRKESSHVVLTNASVFCACRHAPTSSPKHSPDSLWKYTQGIAFACLMSEAFSADHCNYSVKSVILNSLYCTVLCSFLLMLCFCSWTISCFFLDTLQSFRHSIIISSNLSILMNTKLITLLFLVINIVSHLSFVAIFCTFPSLWHYFLNNII